MKVMPNDAPVVFNHFFGSSEQVTMSKMKKCLHKETKHIVIAVSLSTPNKLATFKKIRLLLQEKVPA